MSNLPRAFTIEAMEGVTVHIDDSSDDETFEIDVRDDSGVVESHSGVTADSVVGLESEHFTATHIDPPSAGEA